jgi:hypothetical protein
MSSEFIDLYRTKKVYLWVEDVETRAYLKALWPTENIGILVAPGSDSVRAAVHDARRQGLMQVFGLSDRDFGTSNQHRWAAADFDGHFILPVFEIENFMLDEEALIKANATFSSRPRQTQFLAERLAQKAAEQVWWMAIRHTLADLRRAISGFPSHPGISALKAVHSVDTATAWISEQVRVHSLPVQLLEAVGLAERNALSTSVVAHVTRLHQELAKGAWRREWSGKELFDAALGLLTDYKTEYRLDVVKRIATFQRDNGRIPEAMLLVHSRLQAAAG